MSISALLVLALICVTRCNSLYQTTVYEIRTSSSQGIATNNGMMSAFESSSNVIPYYLQGHLAVGIEHTTVCEIFHNKRVLSWPYDLSHPAARLNNQCKSTPNYLELEEQVPEMIKYPEMLPSGLSYKQYKTNSLPNIGKTNGLMTNFESSPNKHPYYLQGHSAAGIAPTKPRVTNPNADRFSIPGLSYPEARSNVVCGSTTNIFGLEGLLPEVIKYPNILPSGLSSRQHKSNSLPSIVTKDELMPAFESSPSKNPYYLQGHSAAGITPTTPSKTNPNVDRFSIPGLSYPEAGSNVVCESTPNILGLEGLLPEVIKHPNIFPSGLYFKQNKSNFYPAIITRKALTPDFESSPNKNPYYLQGPSAASIAPTTPSETNTNIDGFSIPYCSSHPEAGQNVVCESTPNIFGLEGLLPEVIKYPNILPSGLSSKQHKSNSLPGIVANDELMPAFESSPSKNPYYLQGPSAACIAPTTPSETNTNIDGFGIPYGSSYPEVEKNVVCESSPNILGLKGLVPEVIKHLNIFPLGLSSKQNKPNLLPGINTRKALMPDFESSPNKNSYYLQGPLAANITPTTVLEINPNVDVFSMPYGLHYPEAGSKVVCESTPNILGLEGLLPEVNEHHNILPSVLCSKQHKSNSLPGIVANDELMPAFESSSSKNPYYLQGPSAAGIAPTTPSETNPNVDRFSIPGLPYPEAGSNVVCESTPNILGLEGLVPEVIKYPNIFPSGLCFKQNKSNFYPAIITRKALTPDFESSPNKNPYYLQGNSAANMTPTTVLETNPSVDGFSMPYGLLYPEAGSKVVCESPPNILGLEGLVPEVIKHHNILPSVLCSKQHKSNSLPGIVANDELMPAFESSPSKNPYNLQGPSAAGIAPTTPSETNTNIDGFGIPYGSSHPEAGKNVVCESSPNILGLEGLVPEVIKHPNIFPLGLSSKQNKPNLLPGINPSKALMPDFESSPNKNSYYVQGPLAANITPTTVLEINPNIDVFSMPYGLHYPEAGSKVVCESPPNILGLEGLVPEVIEHHNILPSVLCSKQYKSNSLPGIVANDELMPAFESSPSKNPYYLQGPSAAGIAPTTPSETNPNVDSFRIPGLSYPEAGSNVVCESTPNILGLEGLLPEVIEHHNILPSVLCSKQYKSNSLPGIVANDELMPAFESSPSKNPYYLQGPSAAGIAPTTPSETNQNVDRFSIPGLSYPEAGSNVVCESTPNVHIKYFVNKV